MDQSIGDILSGEPPPEPVVEAAPEAEAETVEAQPETAERPRGPDGKFIAKETDVEIEPGPSPEQPDRLPPAEYAALKDERRKRQAAEDRADALERQYRQPQQTQQHQQPQQPPRFWESEDQDAVLDQRDSVQREVILNEVERRLVAREVERSFVRAKAKYSDFNEAIDEFAKLETLNPTLTQQALATDDPGEFAYQTVKRAREVAQYGSIDALLAAERLKWETEAKAAFQPRQTFPSTTAADGSVGLRSGPEWAGPKPIGDILR